MKKRNMKLTDGEFNKLTDDDIKREIQKDPLWYIQNNDNLIYRDFTSDPDRYEWLREACQEIGLPQTEAAMRMLAGLISDRVVTIEKLFPGAPEEQAEEHRRFEEWLSQQPDDEPTEEEMQKVSEEMRITEERHTAEHFGVEMDEGTEKKLQEWLTNLVEKHQGK